MNIVGLITEYNPFHNGHFYHIQEAKRRTGADAVVVIMSGDYVQRGTPALLPKQLRAKAALLSGADLILELPVCFSTGSAEFFAMGAVSILEQLGCVRSICFGSECADLQMLKTIAELFVQEPAEYRVFLSRELKKGTSYPAARQLALSSYLKSDEAGQILEHPNNTLGIEYLKALCRLNSKILPYTIRRKGSGYHDKEVNEGHYSSASAIRQMLLEPSAFLPGKQTMPAKTQAGLNAQVPPAMSQLLTESYGQRYPVYANDFSLLLKYQLLRGTKEDFLSYMDLSEDLANRILNRKNRFTSFEDFCRLLKTKEMTHARISRCLLHILLGITKEDMETYKHEGFGQYARILGFRKDRTDILSYVKAASSIPLVTKLTQTRELSSTALHMLEQDIFASDLYESVIADKFGTPFVSAYRQQILKI